MAHSEPNQAILYRTISVSTRIVVVGARSDYWGRCTRPCLNGLISKESWPLGGGNKPSTVAFVLLGPS